MSPDRATIVARIRQLVAASSWSANWPAVYATGASAMTLTLGAEDESETIEQPWVMVDGEPDFAATEEALIQWAARLAVGDSVDEKPVTPAPMRAGIAYRCAECQRPVARVGDTFIRVCGHDAAGVVAPLSATCYGEGGAVA